MAPAFPVLAGLAGHSFYLHNSSYVFSEGEHHFIRIKAALSTHRKCGHHSFAELGHLARMQPSCSKPELNTCPGARGSLCRL